MKLSCISALVTGGASGLGEACVRRVVAGGGPGVVAALNEPRDLGPSVRFARTDVSDEASVQAAVELAVREFGALHVCVQCAGVVHGEKILGRGGVHALASFARVIQINLVGTFNV